MSLYSGWIQKSPALRERPKPWSPAKRQGMVELFQRGGFQTVAPGLLAPQLKYSASLSSVRLSPDWSKAMEIKYRRAIKKKT